MTKTQKIFKEMIESAKHVEGENTKIFVSDTISQYVRNKIAELVRKEVGALIIDKELGVIGEEELEREGRIYRIIYKSL